jgi:hypothetical protein
MDTGDRQTAFEEKPTEVYICKAEQAADNNMYHHDCRNTNTRFLCVESEMELELQIIIGLIKSASAVTSYPEPKSTHSPAQQQQQSQTSGSS